MDIKRSDTAQRRQRRLFKYGGGALLVVALAGFGVTTLSGQAASVAKAGLWLGTVQRGELVREVSGAGVLLPRDVRWVTTASAAHVERILVKPGTPVHSDTVIIELSKPDLVDQTMAAEADLRAFEADAIMRKTAFASQVLDQRANIATAVSMAKSAQMQEDAEKELQLSKIIPALQVKRSILANELAKLKVDIERQRLGNIEHSVQAQAVADQARLEQKRQTLALRRHQVDALQVKAESDGVLQQITVEPGQQVLEGANLARVAKSNDLMAQLRIAETQAADVLVGQVVRVDTRNGLVSGKVARVDPTVRAGTVLVDIDLPTALPGGARPDQSVTGTIEIERLQNVLYVGRPNNGKPDSPMSMFKVAPNGEGAERVNVRFGRASVNSIEVKEGLAVGDKVILSDISQWNGSGSVRFK